jgi:hypothetical protein
MAALGILRAVMDPPVDDDTAADPGADRVVDEGVGALPGSLAPLGQPGAVGIVIEIDARTERLRQLADERETAPAGEIERIGDPACEIERPGG